MTKKLIYKIRDILCRNFVIKSKNMLQMAMRCYAEYPNGSMGYQYGSFFEALACFYIEIAEIIHGSHLTDYHPDDLPEPSETEKI